MKDKDKLALIGKMLSDVMEFTKYDDGAKDALICCIDCVVAYETEDAQNEMTQSAGMVFREDEQQ